MLAGARPASMLLVVPGAGAAGLSAGSGSGRRKGRVKPANAQRPGQSQGATQHERSCRLQPVQDLVSPEPLKPVQRLVEGRELLGIDAADRLDRANVLLVKPFDGVAHLATLVGQPDAHRATINARALMVQEAHLDELLEVIGDVGAEIVAARTQLARGEDRKSVV